MSATPKIPNVLRAKRLELIDSEGRLRARIGPRTHRSSDGTYRSYRLELFDANGEVRASVSIDDEGRDSEVFVDAGKDARSHLRAYKPELYPGRAEIRLRGGSGYREIGVRSGCFPDSHEKGPSLAYSVPEIGDLYALDRASREAQSHADQARERSVQARKDGDRLLARREAAEARRIELRIQQAREEFEAREAAREAAWKRKWKELQAARGRDAA